VSTKRFFKHPLSLIVGFRSTERQAPKRGELLPKVYTALGIEMKAKPQKPGFASLMKKFTNVDPYQCVLCGSRMVFNSAEAGIRAEELLTRRRLEFKTERWLRQVV
jgi:hypothetical protein